MRPAEAAGRRRLYRARAVRRRRFALFAFVLVVATAGIALADARRGSETIAYDRKAAARYADRWALSRNPALWSSGDADCANFVSQCLAAGGLPELHEDGSAWHADGHDLPTVSWINCGAQKATLSSATSRHSAYIAQTTEQQPADWARGDIVYLGTMKDGVPLWQHVIICVGRVDGEWVYDSHTKPYRRQPLETWYPEHFELIRFCHIADQVSVEQ